MFSGLTGLKNYYFSSSEQKKPHILKRIEKRPETVNILSLISKLREKKSELGESAAKNGSDSVDYRKHLIIANLLTKIDEKTNAFNQEPASQDPNTEIASLIALSHTLTTIVDKFLTDYSITLQQPRDFKMEVVRKTVDMGSAAVALGTSVLFGLSTLPTIAVLAGAVQANKEGKKALGLNKTTTATYTIVSDLLNSLKQMTQNLSLGLNLENTEQKITDIPIEFICPITKKLLREPVFCKLDNQSYERDAITKYLIWKHKTPLNMEMGALDTTDNVLLPNPILKSLIEKYLMAHPQFHDVESSSRLNRAL